MWLLATMTQKLKGPSVSDLSLPLMVTALLKAKVPERVDDSISEDLRVVALGVEAGGLAPTVGVDILDVVRRPEAMVAVHDYADRLKDRAGSDSADRVAVDEDLRPFLVRVEEGGSQVDSAVLEVV